ncbi:MAG: bifunctional DNA-formamidopyrimidine glycosylase/DNA-(apurinic or apyrimidinic site) lyase [Actinomycetota bacterium]|nr:bifunctional DNA-formamidopyrimidine glycosylase/DNA-(apurinic or apyrimidinic site) lyase [Actinomycetota bacterium]
MPELPEVETVRRGLQQNFVGRKITKVEVGRERTVRRTSREALIDGLTGVKVLSATRRGKYLICALDSGQKLMVHLRMSGRLIIAKPGASRPPHTHVVLHLAKTDSVESELWFVDPRTFGEVVVFDPDKVKTQMPDLVNLGVDPLTDEFSPQILQGLFKNRRGNLKALLLNQHFVAGIGNIYADEILHLAKLRPDRLPGRLTTATLTRLHAAIVEVLNKAVVAGGSTLKDTQYVDLDGQTGSFQDEHRVYGRAGLQCLTCRKGRILMTVVAGRTTCYCSACQH